MMETLIRTLMYYDLGLWKYDLCSTDLNPVMREIK